MCHLDPNFPNLLNHRVLSSPNAFWCQTEALYLGTHSSRLCTTHRCLLLFSQRARFALLYIKFGITKSLHFIQINVTVVTCVASQQSFKGHCAMCPSLLSLQEEMKIMCQGGIPLGLDHRMAMMSRGPYHLTESEEWTKITLGWFLSLWDRRESYLLQQHYSAQYK